MCADSRFQLQGRFVQPAEAAAFLDASELRKVGRTLRRGTAPDALGWTAESWQTLASRDEVFPVLRELLLQYVTGHSGTIAQDLCNLSRLVPLYKDGTGDSLRPIAIPSIWRKVIGKTTVGHFRVELRHAAGSNQYAAMTSDGGARMAAQTRWQAHSQHDIVFVRTDIQNAFNEVSRHAVFEALSYASPLLAASQYAWLSRPSVAVLEHADGHNSSLLTTSGIPQGDPMSSLAFAVTLARPLRALAEDHPDSLAVAYADDMLLSAPSSVIHRVINTWQDAISRIDLSLNQSKVAVWAPRLDAMPPRLAEACPFATFASDGVVLCGLPVDVGPPPDIALPLGKASFTQTFLKAARDKFLVRLRALQALVEALGPASSASHLACQIVRVNLLPAFTHIFRACSWEVSHDWAQQLQHDVLHWLGELLQCPIVGPAAQLTLAMPLRFGGLGLLNLQYEAVLHFLNGSLALCDSHSLSLANSETWSDEVSRAIGFVERVSRLDVEVLLASKAPLRQRRLLRRAFL